MLAPVCSTLTSKEDCSALFGTWKLVTLFFESCWPRFCVTTLTVRFLPSVSVSHPSMTSSPHVAVFMFSSTAKLSLETSILVSDFYVCRTFDIWNLASGKIDQLYVWNHRHGSAGVDCTTEFSTCAVGWHFEHTRLHSFELYCRCTALIATCLIGLGALFLEWHSDSWCLTLKHRLHCFTLAGQSSLNPAWRDDSHPSHAIIFYIDERR